MEERKPLLPAARPRTTAQRAAAFAKPAVIAGAVSALVCAVLLLIIAGLDGFNATVYSVDGKDIRDATDEAGQIRGLYSGARTGGTIFLVLALATAAAGAVVLYLGRRHSRANADDDGGETVRLEDLRG